MLTSTAVQCTGMAHASKVLVYAGNGTAQHFVEDTILTFRRLLGDGYTVTKAYALDLASRAWMNSTSMLIIPGGRASPYAADLDGEANSNIIDYVKEGGVYVGFGAGSYYASHRTEFEKGNPKYEIVRDLPLGFYPGICRGTVFPGFQYDSAEGAKSPDIVAQGTEKTYPAYYNGGGAFIDPDHYPSARVLARYKDVEDPTANAAVVLVKVGDGSALLSGVHVEYIPTMEHPAIYKHIHPFQDDIDVLVRGWLQELNVKISK
ncbi:biotin holocarboxylase synthetase [Entomophthora muscae]|uniref:Biotin holocarboxylase synthetase n=1 Tax=Entomophthora muscae TaxID=34485 RepID=A0ACC2TEY8_9FUNG|nr:biotin holocarboxylase synthetase [Entomophthora muscae]